MANYDPGTVTELASVLDDICSAFQGKDCEPITGPMREILAKRIFEG
jgi:hypothetical protein